ncbi:MAG: GyrI-like domain-containing protein [Prolixibacteraceae bacterium]|jgi:effector-binding domain-containing protein|nr:GyrI-like domain-containing protein [Prolixibacteraceae bacterium]
MKKSIALFTLSLILVLLFTSQKAQSMEKKKVEKQQVLMISIQSSLATIASDPGNLPMEIMKKAVELGLVVTGPQVWQYRNVDGNPTTSIEVDICVPIQEAKGDAGKFKFEVLPQITCISEIHKGAYANLTNTYNRIFGEMTRKGIPMGTVSREVYTVMDMDNEEINITEVQVIINE